MTSRPRPAPLAVTHEKTAVRPINRHSERAESGAFRSLPMTPINRHPERSLTGVAGRAQSKDLVAPGSRRRNLVAVPEEILQLARAGEAASRSLRMTKGGRAPVSPDESPSSAAWRCSG